MPVAVSWGFASWRAGGACTLWVRGDPRARECRGWAWPRVLVYRRRAPLVWEITGFHTHVIPGTGALFAMEHNAWDHALTVTGGGAGLVGHAGVILLRKAADQAGLTAGLGAALRKAGMSPVLDRGIVLA